MNKRIKYVLPTLAIMSFASMQSLIYGQEAKDTVKSNTIVVDNADNIVGEKEGEIYIKYLNGNVRIIHDSTFFYCDSAVINENQFAARGNVVILQKDSTTIFSDSLHYDGDSLMAELSGRVLLEVGKKKLKTSHLEYDVKNKIGYYRNGAQLFQDSTVLKSLKGSYFVKEDMIYFREFVSIIDSSFTLNADSLDFNTKLKTAYFKGPTLIIMDSSKIYCEGGFYNISEKNAEFITNVQYRENDKWATAEKMQYYDKENTFILSRNAHYSDAEETVDADSIIYQRDLNRSILKGHVQVKGEKNRVVGSLIIYNHDSGDFISIGRSTLSEPPLLITADSINYREEQGVGFAFGAVELQDTSSKTTIYCDYLKSTDHNKQFKAYNDTLSRPLMKKLLDRDTLFLSADTLWSQEIIVGTDTSQILNAYHRVKLYHNSYQAICDSMKYYLTDSMFVMIDEPVLWSDTSQFTGDTISIYFKNEEVHQIFIRKNALIVSAQNNNLFNQIRGKELRAFFRDDSLRTMLFKGNAESLYYLKDKNEGFVGAINTVCSKMDFYFDGNNLLDIKYYENPVSNMTTMKQEISNPQRLKGFRWLANNRPLSIFDILQSSTGKIVAQSDDDDMQTRDIIPEQNISIQPKKLKTANKKEHE